MHGKNQGEYLFDQVSVKADVTECPDSKSCPWEACLELLNNTNRLKADHPVRNQAAFTPILMRESTKGSQLELSVK